MSAIDSPEALRDAIRASTGPDRELDAAFARLVLGWIGVNFDEFDYAWFGTPPVDNQRRSLPRFFDPSAGPGALFAAARERWPECCLSAEALPAKYGCSARFIQSHAVAGFAINELGAHPILAHALARAMVEAAISERDRA